MSDPYERLKPPRPTPADEIGSCPDAPPITLNSLGGLTYNPIHCLDCNLEVPPLRLGLGPGLVQAVAHWQALNGAISGLELDSGPYEAWARQQLLDPDSPANAEGRALAAELSELRPCYLWFWQPEADWGFQPRTTCPVCEERLEAYGGGKFPRLLCERDHVMLAGDLIGA
jgi:hypothetical protein